MIDQTCALLLIPYQHWLLFQWFEYLFPALLLSPLCFKALSAAASSTFPCLTCFCLRRESVSAGRRVKAWDQFSFFVFWHGVADCPKEGRDFSSWFILMCLLWRASCMDKWMHQLINLIKQFRHVNRASVRGAVCTHRIIGGWVKFDDWSQIFQQLSGSQGDTLIALYVRWISAVWDFKCISFLRLWFLTQQSSCCTLLLYHHHHLSCLHLRPLCPSLSELSRRRSICLTEREHYYSYVKQRGNRSQCEGWVMKGKFRNHLSDNWF